MVQLQSIKAAYVFPKTGEKSLHFDKMWQLFPLNLSVATS